MRRRTIFLGMFLGAGAITFGWWFAHSRDRIGDRRVFNPKPNQAAFNGWLKITNTGRIIVAAPRAEMGQGIHTTIAQLAAEELDARWSDMEVEDAPESPIYRNVEVVVDGLPFSPEEQGTVVSTARWAATRVAGIVGLSVTGGSTSARDAWEPVRHAGAAARNMLLRAAARRFNLAIDDLVTIDSEVRNREDQRLATYADLVPLLVDMAQPFQVVPKPRSQYRLIGKSVERLDVPAKVRGSAQFGIDVRIPGMLYAAIRHCPVLGGRLVNLREPATPLPTGIRRLVRLPDAVAAVSDSWWRAQRFLSSASDADLGVEWDHGSGAQLDTKGLWTRFERQVRESEVDFERGKRDAPGPAEPTATVRRLEARYRVPYLAHATMEPMNCTARFDLRGGLEVWMPSQSASLARRAAARTAGVDADRVTVHTTFLGGGFGRRAEMDLVREAVLIAREFRGTAVQLLWSREEDMQHDFYRPMVLADMSAGLNEAGTIVDWRMRMIGQTATSQYPSRNLGLPQMTQPDPNSVENPAYRYPDHKVEAIIAQLPVPVGFWRSVGHSHTAFFEECFLDEVADATRTDPLALRRQLLQGRNRHLAVLDRVAREAGWGTALPEGRARGLAMRASFGSIVAQVAEVSVAGKEIRVHRVTCAIDCGPVINPAIVTQQMSGGIVFGLTAALYGEITLEKGRVQQSNFHDYDMIRLADAPHIDVHTVDTGAEIIGGVGEPGTPPIAPAVANAVFALTGKRLRSLPLRLE